MYLKQLIITKNTGEVIRNIPFKMGLNLILGDSDETGSSNSLGKTTLVRCINFCLAGKVEEFYVDSESKKIENTTIKNYLLENQVIFELTLGKNFDQKSVLDIKISRQIIFNYEDDKIEIINKINNNEYSNEKFQETLKLKLFGLDLNKPTFRNIITKFVRRTDIEVNNILKYLNVYTTNIDYTTLRFFLFGFSNPEIIERKQSLEKEFSKIGKQHKALKAVIPEGIQQKIDLLQTELSEKENLRDSFQIEQEYNIDENELAQIEIKITNLDKTLTSLNSDKLTLIQRLENIRQNEFKENPQNIKYLYEEAKLLNIDIQKKFEDTINFHNNMLKNEENYLLKRIEKLNINISMYDQEWINLTGSYNLVLHKLSKQGALAEYTKLNENIIKITADISNSKALLGQLELLNTQKVEIQKQVTSISSEIKDKIDTFQKINIHVFNTYFSKYSEKLYNEKWYVSFDPDGESFKFDVKAFESNAGSGKKQTLVAAFDIAYIAFIQDTQINLPYPRFATQDKIEVIDISELDQLSQLILKANGQLIAPIIQDKFKNFKEEEFLEKVILRLSPSNKFFQI